MGFRQCLGVDCCVRPDSSTHGEWPRGAKRGQQPLILGHGGQGVGVRGSVTLLWEGLAVGNRRLVLLHWLCCSFPGWSRASQPLLSSIQLLSRVQLFATPWTAAHQASLSITNSQSLLKRMSIESAMPSNHLILCHPLLLLPSVFPSIRVFSNESVLRIRWPNIGVSALSSVLPMNTQD